MEFLEEEGKLSNKKRKVEDHEFVLPQGFLAPLKYIAPLSSQAPLFPSQPSFVTPLSEAPMPLPEPCSSLALVGGNCCNQFWKAGDYELPSSALCSASSGMDHVRVHPKFLHSNATSHLWALGAFAELLDNSVDEIRHGATYVMVDVLENKKDKKNMLLVQDNGGGMSTSTIRNCMSLGYSGKSKFANTIGQYGNGFKTSTMRLGADVIVFTRCRGKDEGKPTQSIGMLSYTYLRSTGKDEIVVPILDYEKNGPNSWKKKIRSSWDANLESILQWSPYCSEADLVKEFELMGEQGTRIIIYNLWELEQGKFELDFETDPQDIQLTSVERDQQKVEEAKKYPSSRHFLTYQHSMRSYASILYLNLPSDFKIILRGEPVKHHRLVDDMMLRKQVTYTPLNCFNARTNITLGFVKDAVHHINIQGFNVYHNNRLIKPFWKVWTVAGSGGRGITGVLEANFVKPAHNKQGFEETPLLKRLQHVLNTHQKTYWNKNKDRIGYVAPLSNTRPREDVKVNDSSLVSLTQPRNLVPIPQSKGTSGACDEGKAAPYLNVQQNVQKQKLQDRVQKREDVYSANLQIERETSKKVETQSNEHAYSPTMKTIVESSLRENQSNTHASSQTILLSENNKLKHTLRFMQSEKSNMESNLKNKSQQVEELTQKADAKLKEIVRETDTKLKEKDQHIEKLKEANARLKEIGRETDTKLKEKDQHIEKLKEANARLEEHTKKTNAKLVEIAREARTHLKEKDHQIEILKKVANARNEMVNQDRNRRDDEEAILRMKLMEANAVIEDLQKKICASSVKPEPNY